MHGGKRMIILTIASLLLNKGSAIGDKAKLPPEVFLARCAKAASKNDYSWIPEIKRRSLSLLSAARKDISSKDPQLRLVALGVIGRVWNGQIVEAG